jgi:hypothetical protein
VFKKGTILFSGYKEHLDFAKEYCEDMGLTGDDVKITINRKEELNVTTKRTVDLQEREASAKPNND